MRAVVTGGAGFIGSHLIERLVDRGDDVVCIEHPMANTRWVDRLPIDLRRHGIDNRRQLTEAFRDADVVFHLAGLTQARKPADYYTVNTEGTARVLRAAARLGDGAPHFIFASSQAAGGPSRNGDPVSLDDVPQPLSHYGHSKLLAEVVVHAYADRVSTVILRPSTVYGPRERAVLKFFQLVKRGIALTIGRWDRELCMVYVDDLVDAFITAASSERAVGRTFYVAHPHPLSWRDFGDAVGQALERQPRFISVPRAIAHGIALGAEITAWLQRTAAILNRERVREMTQARWVCDVSATTQQLGFQPAYSLARGVLSTAAWYREAGWI